MTRTPDFLGQVKIAGIDVPSEIQVQQRHLSLHCALPENYSYFLIIQFGAGSGDSAASLGNLGFYPPDVAGHWVEWNVGLLEPGAWLLSWTYEANVGMGIMQASLDGVNLGATIDMYSGGWLNASRTFVVAPTQKTSRLRFTITSKNASASHYWAKWTNIRLDKQEQVR